RAFRHRRHGDPGARLRADLHEGARARPRLRRPLTRREGGSRAGDGKVAPARRAPSETSLMNLVRTWFEPGSGVSKTGRFRLADRLSAFGLATFRTGCSRYSS